MGEKQIEISPNWRHCGKLLPTAVVCAITGFSADTVLRLVRSGRLIPSLGKRPYRFDPEHIYEVFFGTKTLVLNDSVRSLKTEKSGSIGHKPVKKEDLWTE